jgi:hypothetical protein
MIFGFRNPRAAVPRMTADIPLALFQAFWAFA